MNSPFHSLANHLFGTSLAQSWADLALWEEFLNETEVGAIVELGTHGGGMSQYLDFQSRVRGLRFYTFDIERVFTSPSIHFRFRQMDIFKDWPAWYEYELGKSNVRAVILCDNGDKPRELRMVADTVRVGDYVAVHDYGTEWKPEDIPDCLDPLMWSRTVELMSVTRFFRKV